MYCAQSVYIQLSEEGELGWVLAWATATRKALLSLDTITVSASSCPWPYACTLSSTLHLSNECIECSKPSQELPVSLNHWDITDLVLLKSHAPTRNHIHRGDKQHSTATDRIISRKHNWQMSVHLFQSQIFRTLGDLTVLPRKAGPRSFSQLASV